MSFIKLSNKIIIDDLKDFNIDHILLCGQIFRYRKTDYGYDVLRRDKMARVYVFSDKVEIVTDDVDYFYDYFDLNTDYAKVKEELSKFSQLQEPLKFGYGIRILRQDIFETIISFIISANNNIKRIQGIIERISEGFGTKNGDFYAFPTLEQLKKADENFYKSIGAGYRSAYLSKVVFQLENEEFDIEKLQQMNTEDLRKQLIKLCGVGPKVADCILLFGFGRGDVFPVDTWTRKVYEQDFGGSGKLKEGIKITQFFVEKFGTLAGVAQQYLFFHKRSGEEG